MADVDADKLNEAYEHMRKFADMFGATTPELDKFIKVTSKGHKEFKKEIDALNKEIKKGKAGYEQQKQKLDELNDALEELGDTTNNAAKTTEKHRLLAERDALAHSALMRGVMEDTAEGVSNSAVSMTQGAGAFVKGLQANQSAAQLSGDLFKVGIDVAAAGMKTAGGMAEKFGDKMMNSANPFVAAIGMVTSGVGMLAQASAETAAKIAKFGVDVLQAEVEKTYKAFNSMSASGAMFADGMTGMRNAAGKAGLTVDLFAGVLKNQSANIAASGLGMNEGAKRIGGALTAGGDKMKKSLLSLGFSFEEQAELVAETMKDMRGVSTGPLKASNQQVAEQTQKYAENLRVITAITGEDAKKKMEETRNQANQLMFQQKLAGMDETQRKNIINAMGNMSKQQQTDYMDMINFGSIINTTGAVLSSTIPEYGKSIRDSVEATKNNTLDDVKQRQINAAHHDAMNRQLIANTGTAAAGAAGLSGVASENATASMDLLNFNKTQTAEAIKQAEADRAAQEKTADGLTQGVVDAETAAMELKKSLQTILTPAIMDFANVSKKMLQTVKDTLHELGYDKTKEQKAKDADNTKAMKAQYDKTNPLNSSAQYDADVKAWNDKQKDINNLNELRKTGTKEEVDAEIKRQADAKKGQQMLYDAGLSQIDPSKPSIVENYMNGITAHDKGGSIDSGKLGLVGEKGPELISGPANVLSTTSSEKLLNVLNAMKLQSGTLTGDDGMDKSVTSSEALRGIIANELKGFESFSQKQIQDAIGITKVGNMSSSLGGYQSDLHNTPATEQSRDTTALPSKSDNSAIAATLHEQNGLLSSILASLNKGNSLSSGILQNSY